ncbi:glycosyltransferase family 2 protein [Candidatus Sumerlaeota bacterium]|nr:glycosyltransferase family 2 protein [Candidatus Sumerlaeota bacterium]
MEPSFLIVIVLYNSAEWIARCLEAIAKCRRENLRVVVVDNASTDNAGQIVMREYPWARLVTSPFNRGFAGGNNWGVANAPATENPADYIFLVNPDVELYPDCLDQLARAFAENPALGVAGCKIYYPDGVTIQHVGGGLRANGLSYHLGEGEQDRGQYRGLMPCDYVQGAALAVRRNVWEQLHGFDDAFFPAYYEEADFCKRARDTGWEVATVCDARVIHHQDPKQQVQSRNFLRMLFRGRARYLMKHYRASDWFFRFIPSELKWLLSSNSKRYRRVALRSFWDLWAGGD